MKTIKRWIFWIISGLVFVGACMFGYMVFNRYNELQATYSKVIEAQKRVSKYSNSEFPTEKTIVLAEGLLEKWKGDLKQIVLSNYKREHSETKFELFFSDFGLTDDHTTIDLNKYRSIYETSRDEVLGRVKKDGNISFGDKSDTGFQFFEKNAVLSSEVLPMIQKRFWISKAIYESLISYNSTPTLMAGWEFTEGEGDKAKDVPAFITTVNNISHKGMYSPPDLPEDDSQYEATRDVMQAFYYFKYWRVNVSMLAPSAAVPGIVRVLEKHPLMFRIKGLDIRAIEKQGLDRYSAPQSLIVLDLLVSDFDEELFAPLLPGYVSETPENVEGK